MWHPQQFLKFFTNHMKQPESEAEQQQQQQQR